MQLDEFLSCDVGGVSDNMKFMLTVVRSSEKSFCFCKPMSFGVSVLSVVGAFTWSYYFPSFNPVSYYKTGGASVTVPDQFEALLEKVGSHCSCTVERNTAQIPFRVDQTNWISVLFCCGAIFIGWCIYRTTVWYHKAVELSTNFIEHQNQSFGALDQLPVSTQSSLVPTKKFGAYTPKTRRLNNGGH